MSIRSSITDLFPIPALTAARTVRWRAAKARSEFLASLPSSLDSKPSTRPPAFIVGAGRSGTTALGRALSFAPRVDYFFEPVDRWFAISPDTDYGGMFDASAGRCLLGASDANESVRRRFRRVFRHALLNDVQMLEKTPINAFRIDFLEAIDDRTKYVEIRRDGADVVRSIVQLSRRNDYSVLGRAHANRWWGVHDCKWKTLSRDLGDFDLEPEFLVPQAEFATRAAIEWIASLKSVERAADRLGDRLYRVNHNDLVSRPEETLAGIAAFLGVPEGDWMMKAADSVRVSTRRSRIPLVLPGAIARRLNTWNERLGFAGRAIEGPHLSGFTTECQTTGG